MTNDEMKNLIEKVESLNNELCELSDSELHELASQANISWRVLDVLMNG